MDLSYPLPAYRQDAAHIYLLPHPGLRAAVAHYTLCLASAAPAGSGAPLTLIPDASGCLVFDLAPNGLRGKLFGPTTRVVTVCNDWGLCPFRFFIECPPGGLYTLTGLPQWALADRILPLADVLPALEQAVSEAFLRASDLPAFVSAVDALLLSRSLADNPARPLLAAALRGEDLSRLGWSPRHLSRLFRLGAGMGPSSFRRVLRINAAVARLERGAPSLTRLAQDLGYYDQSHFIHDFSSVTGLTPGAYRASMADFYKEPLKL